MKSAPASPQEVKMGLAGKPTSERTPVVISGLNKVFHHSKSGSYSENTWKMGFKMLQMPTSEKVPTMPFSGVFPPHSTSHAPYVSILIAIVKQYLKLRLVNFLSL